MMTMEPNGIQSGQLASIEGVATKQKEIMSGSAAFFCLTLCPGGIYFRRTLGHSCRTLSDVRRLFPGLDMLRKPEAHTKERQFPQ